MRSKIVVIPTALFVVVTLLSHFQIIGGGGAIWYLGGPERIEVRNNNSLPLIDIKVEDSKGNFRIINHIPASGIKKIKMDGGETNYRLSTSNTPTIDSGWVYTEPGNCLVFEVSENEVSHFIGGAIEKCFWL